MEINLPTWTQLAANALLTGATYALVACSFNIIYRVLGYYYVILGSLLAVAPMVTHWLNPTHPSSTVLAVVAGVSVSVSIALLDHCFVYRPMKARNAVSLSHFLASTGAYFLVTNGLLWFGGPEARAFSTAGLGVLEVAGARMPITGAYLIVGSSGVWITLLLWIRLSRSGMAMRAVADDEQLAAIVGIPPKRIELVAVMVAATISGLGGILIGLNQSVRFNMGMPLLLKGILVSAVAGMGSIGHIGCAALLIGALEVAVVALLPSGIKDVVLFCCLALTLVVRPDGLMIRTQRTA